MNKLRACPHSNNCLLLQKTFNQDCEICRACRKGTPEEYAVHVENKESSRVYRLSDLPSVKLGIDTELVSIYRLADQHYYSKEVIAFQPSSPDDKLALFSQLTG